MFLYLEFSTKIDSSMFFYPLLTSHPILPCCENSRSPIWLFSRNMTNFLDEANFRSREIGTVRPVARLQGGRPAQPRHSLGSLPQSSLHGSFYLPLYSDRYFFKESRNLSSSLLEIWISFWSRIFLSSNLSSNRFLVEFLAAYKASREEKHQRLGLSEQNHFSRLEIILFFFLQLSLFRQRIHNSPPEDIQQEGTVQQLVFPLFRWKWTQKLFLDSF